MQLPDQHLHILKEISLPYRKTVERRDLMCHFLTATTEDVIVSEEMFEVAMYMLCNGSGEAFDLIVEFVNQAAKQQRSNKGLGAKILKKLEKATGAVHCEYEILYLKRLLKILHLA